MSIISIKMNNGEEVLADLVSESDISITVDKPRVLSLINNQGQTGLIPFLMADPDRRGVVLNKRGFITHYPVDADIARAYMQATTSLILG